MHHRFSLPSTGRNSTPLPFSKHKFSTVLISSGNFHKPLLSAVTTQSLQKSRSKQERVHQFPSTHFLSFSRKYHATVAVNAVVPFKLADIGEGIAECELLKWHIQEGDHIQEFQLLCEVQSDKANVEITSRYNGTVKKLYYKKGEMAKVGSTLMDIEVANTTEVETATQSSPETSAIPSSTAANQGKEANQQKKVVTTPAVRHLAAKYQIDLSQVKGTGRDGRIHKEDILAFTRQGKEKQTSISSISAQNYNISVPISQQPSKVPSETTTYAQTIPELKDLPPSFATEDQIVPLTGYYRAMVKSMTAANQIPHFGYCDEVIVDRLQEYRGILKSAAAARGVKLSNLSIIIKATSMALRHYPRLNSIFDEKNNALIYKASHNIGIAMDTPQGLIVPNIKNVQDKSIFEIASELNRLQDASLNGNVVRADLTGGTFTLSNIGSIGGTYASPVIVVPEVAIGAIGRIQKLPRFDEKGNVVPVQIFNISWAADHRVIDGATMANFSNLWKKYLENPSLMLFDLR